MDFTPEGLRLSREEAGDLARVIDCAAGIRSWLDPFRMQPVEKTQSAEDEHLAYITKRIVAPFQYSRDLNEQQEVVVPTEHLPNVRRFAEVALENSTGVAISLCIPSPVDGYYPELLPHAYRVLARTAEVVEVIRRHQPANL